MRYALATLTGALIAWGTFSTDANAQVIYRGRYQDQDVQLLDSWYKRYLGRAVDDEGLRAWMGELARGSNVEAGILASDEYFNRVGGTPEDFVASLYLNILGRQPRLDEVQGWLARFQQSGWNRTQVADEFIRSSAAELSLRGVVPQTRAPYPEIYQQPIPTVPYVDRGYVVSQPSWYQGSYWHSRYFAPRPGALRHSPWHR